MLVPFPMPSLRNATDSDIDILVNLYLNEVEDNEANAQVFARDLLYRMRTILYFEGEKLCGTISWEVRGGLDDGVAEIVGLGVNESNRRKGLASLLIEEVISEASETFREANAQLRILFLFMEAENTTARAFYNHLGFKEVANIPSFYPQDGASIFVRAFSGTNDLEKP